MNTLTASTVTLPLSALEALKKLEEASAIIQKAYARSPRAKKEASKKALELFKQYAPKAVRYLGDSSALNSFPKKKDKALSLLPALSLICHENTSHGPPSELDSITETRSS